QSENGTSNNSAFFIDTLKVVVVRRSRFLITANHFCRRVTRQTTLPKRATNGGRCAGQLLARGQLTSTSRGSCRRGVSQLHCRRRFLEDVATRSYADDQAD